jgi:hypothetical protein
MNRAQLEHIIRAAATIADDDEIVVFGSQAILGQFPDAPEELLQSMEADVYPRRHPDRADLIEGSIGEVSPFHETFGYYAQGVAPETAVLPRGWESRLVPVRTPATRGATGLCLEVHDLAIAKYVAGREKDGAYLQALIKHGLVQEGVMLERIEDTPVDQERMNYISRAITRDFRARSAV